MAAISNDFQVFAKPAGPACNLSCRYCYYLGKRDLYPAAVFRMGEALLEQYIVQHIAASSAHTVHFSWHGGEPTILGLSYFERIVALQRRHTPPGRRTFNGIQTNGVLIDEAWCDFLAREGFGVGLSLDGPAAMHDAHRVTHRGEATHTQAVRAFERLLRHGVTCDVLCVVHDANVRKPLEVYRFFRDLGARYITFLPLVERLPGGVSTRTAVPEAFGAFLCSVFDEWMRRDCGRIFVQIFEEASRPLRGLDHSLCIFRETCGQVPVIEHNGDVFSCDHFVDPEHRLGNVGDTALKDLIDSPAQAAFGNAKRDSLPRYCRECNVLDMCNGGCPKDRFAQTPDGGPGLNYLCPGFKAFFKHARAPLSELIERAQAQESARELAATATVVSASTSVGRNDPCPCGSGRKYKKCCRAGAGA